MYSKCTLLLFELYNIGDYSNKADSVVSMSLCEKGILKLISQTIVQHEHFHICQKVPCKPVGGILFFYVVRYKYQHYKRFCIFIISVVYYRKLLWLSTLNDKVPLLPKNLVNWWALGDEITNGYSWLGVFVVLMIPTRRNSSGRKLTLGIKFGHINWPQGDLKIQGIFK